MNVEREALGVLQRLVWTTGKVVDAIRKTNGIEEISQSFLRHKDSPDSTVTSMIVEVLPESGTSIYRLARILSSKIEKAQRRHIEEHGKNWHSAVLAKYLHWEITPTSNDDEDRYAHSGITTDIWGRQIIRIVVSPRRVWS